MVTSNALKSEKQWRAEDDARTLAEAEAIKIDKSRLLMARKAAKKMATEANVKARAMSKIASSKAMPAMRIRAAKG